MNATDRPRPVVGLLIWGVPPTVSEGSLSRPIKPGTLGKWAPAIRDVRDRGADSLD